MVELPVFVAEPFSWYICFGIIIHLSWSNPQGFYKEYKGVYFTMFLKILFQLTTFSAHEKRKSAWRSKFPCRPIGNLKCSHHLKIRPLNTIWHFQTMKLVLICVFVPLVLNLWSFKTNCWLGRLLELFLLQYHGNWVTQPRPRRKNRSIS
jgi:hypothetical protein